jgi:hypothetical protein
MGSLVWYCVISAAGWSSSEARRAHNPKVVGSNPTPATKRTSGLRTWGSLLCKFSIVDPSATNVLIDAAKTGSSGDRPKWTACSDFPKWRCECCREAVRQLCLKRRNHDHCGLWLRQSVQTGNRGSSRDKKPSHSIGCCTPGDNFSAWEGCKRFHVEVCELHHANLVASKLQVGENS